MWLSLCERKSSNEFCSSLFHLIVKLNINEIDVICSLSISKTQICSSPNDCLHNCDNVPTTYTHNNILGWINPNSYCHLFIFKECEIIFLENRSRKRSETTHIQGISSFEKIVNWTKFNEKCRDFSWKTLC
jgi:hypothetical protein